MSSIRYYLIPIIGDGTHRNPYRVALRATNISVAAHIPSKEDGTPAVDEALCVVRCEDHDNLIANFGHILTPLPDRDLDTPITSFSSADMSVIDQKLSSGGQQRILDANMKYEDILVTIGDSKEKGFDLSKLREMGC